MKQENVKKLIIATSVAAGAGVAAGVVKRMQERNRETARCKVSSGVEFFKNVQLNDRQLMIGKQILREIRGRIGFLNDVGLDYLSLSQATGTLSGGEAQRIRLATQIGSGLVGVAYILDEPSIGLHQRDNDKLIHALKSLRDLGNSLIVVEHDEDTMLAADYIVDIGPEAGEYGGEVVATGTAEELMRNPNSITGRPSGELQIYRRIPPEKGRSPSGDARSAPKDGQVCGKDTLHGRKPGKEDGLTSLR